MKYPLFQILLLALLFPCLSLAQTVQIKGVVVDEDSTTAMPYVYVINKNTGLGDMCDFNGHFSVVASLKDTLVFSFVGYLKIHVPAQKVYVANGEGKVIMKKMAINLSMVTVSSFKIKPYEREYMKNVIAHSKTSVMTAINSPITALYDQFSKKGKEKRKLAAIFEDIFTQEQVAKKLNPEILRNLTDDPNIDYEAFRKYCYYLSDDYIINHDGVELYTQVMNCYYRWREEKRER